MEAPAVRPPTPSSAPSRRKTFFLIGLAVLLLSFGSGYYAGEERGQRQALGSGQVLGKGTTPTPAYLGQDVDFKLFWEIWDLLEEKYVDRPIANTKLFYGALSGLVSGVGDPYTVFLDPKTAEEFSQELSGSFEGIGAEIGLRDNQVVVIAPLAETPAERAGVRAGDRVLAIDGRETTGMTIEAAVSAIRGKGGTAVTLTLLRDGLEKSFAVRIVRDRIAIQSVTSSMKQAVGSDRADVAYLKISHFNEDTGSAFERAVRQALNERPRAVILDLRNNPGGFLETAVEVASYWIPDGPVVVQQERGDRRTEFPSRGKAVLEGLKTVVLVNAGSASASEIVAGALQDYGVGTLVGQKTFGKGSVQELRDLSDGSAVKVTVAKWLTPKGRSINEAGITPDIVVATDEGASQPDADLELDRALELLKP